MKIKRFLSAMCIVAGMCACDDGIPENLEFEQFKNLYFSAATGVTKTISLSGERDTSFIFGNVTYNGTTNFGQGNIVAEIGADTTLVETYNTEHDTEFKPLPEESFAFNMTKLVIENGRNYSGVVKLFVSPKRMESGQAYLLPVSILSTSGNIAVNEEKRTAYWAFMVSGGGNSGNQRPIPKDVYPMEFRSETAARITVTSTSEYTTLLTAGSDPFISTTTLGRALTEGSRMIAFEYKSNKASTNAEFFFCVAGGPEGGANGKSSGQSIAIPEAADWTWFEYDIEYAITSWGFGVNNSGGRAPAEHFLRFDPVADGSGYEIIIRKFQIEVH
jgi:hypothetical protein